jgi:DNA-binding CsgD family transcriptional regulator
MIDTEGLLGREAELAAVGRFIAAMETGPAGLALEGEPGIGKTVLVGHAVDEARSRAYRTLTATPTSAESNLSFVGLTDLLSDAHELFGELPAPQRRALEIALLLEEDSGEPPDPRAIGLGLLGVLGSLAASHPVVVAVDDLQWLDAPSAAALSFALRRITTEPVGLLAAMRKDAGAAATELGRALGGERVTVGSLSVGAIHAILSERLQLSVPRSLLLRIHDACRGNPLFALELGRALQERRAPEPGRPFEIPADVETLFSARLGRLPTDTLDALAIAAASAAPTTSLVAVMTGDGRGLVEPALSADVIHIESGRIRFTHPLFASAVYGRLDPMERRDLHRRIAAAVEDREERAHHLALAADAPDAEVAAALDVAAEQAAGRGAPVAAAELAELALKLTPHDDADDLRARKRSAAQHHFYAGNVARARELLARLVDELPPGTERARALLQLAEAHSGSQSISLPLRERAVGEAVGDDRVLAPALRELALTLFVTGKPVPALGRAREALAAAERVRDVQLLVPSLVYLAWIELWNGRVPQGLLERAFALEEQAGYLRIYESPLIVDGVRLMILEDDLDGARTRLEEAEAVLRDHGDDEARAILLDHLAELECRTGRFEIAAHYATEAYAIRVQLGLGAGSQLYFIALVEALRGHARAARASADRGLELCEEEGYEAYAVRNLRVLGFLALSSGDSSTAARILEPLPERLAASGYGRVSVLQVLPDAIEALIAVGKLDRAAVQLEQLEGTAREFDIASAVVRAARCRGLLAAARRDDAAAFAAFDDALAAHERLPDPLERGRTLLALGQTQRRAGHRRDARETLEQAQAIFEQLGAALWEEQARAEVERLGGRTSSGHDLTGAEERVARLVADGKTNREVAAALFVTERTVETHLSSIYRKLDLRSRSELAGRLAESDGRRSS